MTEQAKAGVSFVTVSITAPEGPLMGINFSKCELCNALLLDLEEDRQKHTDWHGGLRREVGIAGLGFGGFGLGGPL